MWSHLAPDLPVTERDSSLLPTRNLVDRTVRERHHEQVAVRAGLDVGDDAEVAAEQQALALDEGFSSICPRTSPPGSRRVWKLMYDWPARMFGSWSVSVVLLPSARSHLLKTMPPLNGVPMNPKRTPALVRKSRRPMG